MIDIHDKADRFEVKCSSLVDSSFDDVNMSKSSLTNANMTEIKVGDADLSGTRFEDVNMSNVSIDNVLLTGMKINGVPVSDLFAAYRARTTQDD